VFSDDGTICEWPLGFDGFRPHPLDGPIDRGSPDTEKFGELSLGVGPGVVQLQQVLGLVWFQLRLSSRVRSRIRSDSNSATIAKTLNSNPRSDLLDHGSSRRG